MPLFSSSQAAVRTALVNDLINLWKGLATPPRARVEKRGLTTSPRVRVEKKRGLATSPRARAEVANDMFLPLQAGPPASEGTFYDAGEDVVAGLIYTDQCSDDLVLEKYTLGY